MNFHDVIGQKAVVAGGSVWQWAAAAALWLFGSVAVVSATAELPRITGIERRGEVVTVRASVPEGVARLVLEACVRDDWRGWVPRAVARVQGAEVEVTFTVPAKAGTEMFRVRADETDPLPAAFYSGTTNFPGEWLADGVSAEDAFLRGGDVAAPTANEDGAAGREVVESDIWVLREDRLYFFNQFRGLQTIDISDPDHPRVEGTFSMPGAGEQMYLLGDHDAVLLAHDPCSQWGVEAESAVVLVDVTPGEGALREAARFPLKGRIVESRLVGEALYVATETWQPVPDGNGAWEAGTWVAGFDLSDPSSPDAHEPLWFPGSGNVVTATDQFLFVAITDYSRSWPWRTDLQVIDISSPDGTLRPFATIPLSGRVADKFKMDVWEGVLRVVVEAMDAPSGGRWVTVLETIRLSDPGAAAPEAFTRLDRLELAHGERLFATRFDGAKAYIVTFLRIDPLWIIDLSAPDDLKVAGELEIPGWSTYIRPMGDRLLTLGVDDARGWRVAVQLFDVSDPSRPGLLAKVPLGENSSWSEANQDEKAFGVIPEAGLLLVPVSEWTGSESKQGVQLIDFDRDHLNQRGLLASESVVPRRATWRENRVLAISGRELVTADVTDRDRPEVVAVTELAYPVERVVVGGGYRLEVTAGSIRVLPVMGDTDAPEWSVEIGDLPVWGATLRGDRLHTVQGRAAEVSWIYDERSNEWAGQTNPGVVVVTTWDASDLPRLTKVGESTSDTRATWVTDLRPLWLGEDLLVWGDAAPGSYYWRWDGPFFAEDALVRSAMPVPGIWSPWWYGGSRRLLATEIGSDGVPRIVSETELDGEGTPSGELASAGFLVFSTRRVTESEVTGTNQIVEKVWIPGVTRWETNVVNSPDGASKTNIVRLEESEGEWQTVTNDYPVLRWWARYVLDVVDFSGSAADPVKRPPLVVPGRLQGLARQGAVLVTLGERTEDPAKAAVTWLEASAYDGVEVSLIDSINVADQGSGDSAVVAVEDDLAYVARGGWSAETDRRLEVWTLDMGGRWVGNRIGGLSAGPGELKVFRDLLLARNGGVLDLFDREVPESPKPLPVLEIPGCYGGDLGRGSGDRAHGLWLPLGEYGAVRVGP